MQILAQRALQFGPRSGRPAEAEVDPPGKQRIERPELFGDLERRMVGQHDSARPDPDGRGGIADMRQHDCSRPAGNPGHGMVLGHPETLAAGLLGGLREHGHGIERLSQRAALADGDEIEHGEIGHDASCSR